MKRELLEPMLNPILGPEIARIHRDIESGRDSQGAVLGEVCARGFVWNPLRRFPPNNQCFCHSGRKFKKCCRDKLSTTLPEETGKRIEGVWDRVLSGELWFRVVLDETEQTATLTSNCPGLFQGLPKSREIPA